MSIFRRLFKADETNAAIIQAKKHVRENPQDASAWVALGDVVANVGQYKEAVACYTKALEFDSRPNIVVRAANMLVMIKEYDTATKILKGLTENFPTMSSVWGSLAMAYFEAQKWEQAIKAASKASELAPDLDMSAIIGRSYLNLKDYEHALPVLERATQLHPNDADHWYVVGRCLNELKKPDAALDALKKATDLNPKDEQTWLELITLYLDQGDDKNAVAAMEHAAKINPTFRTTLSEMKQNLLKKDQVRLDAPKGHKQSPEEWLYSFVQFFFQHHEVDSVTDAFMLGLPLYNETFVNEVEAFVMGRRIQGSVMFQTVAAATAGNLTHVYRNYIAKGKGKREIRDAFEDSARDMLKGHESALH